MHTTLNSRLAPLHSKSICLEDQARFWERSIWSCEQAPRQRSKALLLTQMISGYWANIINSHSSFAVQYHATLKLTKRTLVSCFRCSATLQCTFCTALRISLAARAWCRICHLCTRRVRPLAISNIFQCFFSASTGLIILEPWAGLPAHKPPTIHQSCSAESKLVCCC